MKCPKSYGNITDEIVGHKFQNGVGLVTQPYFYRFFLEEGFEVLNEYNNELPKNIETIFLQHHGGLGDTLFIEPVIECYREMFPDAKITLCCKEEAKMLFHNNPHLNSFSAIREGRYSHFINQYDLSVTFDCIIAGNPYAQLNNIYDEYKSWAGIPIEISQKHLTPKLYVGADEIINIQNKLKELYKITTDDKIVVINYHTSSPIRNLEKIERFYEIGARINGKYGYKILMMGLDNAYFSDLVITNCIHCGKENKLVLKDNISNITYKCHNCKLDNNLNALDKRLKEMNTNIYFPELNIREWISLITYANYFVGLDSIGLHIAGALGTPSLGIFGPFDPDLRTRYYSNCRIVTPDYYCTNCFLHHIDCPQGLRRDKNYSMCMESITNEKILKEFDKLANNEKFENKTFVMAEPISCPVCYSENRSYIGRKGEVCYYDCKECGATYADQIIDGSFIYNDKDYYNIYIKDGYKEGQREIAVIINELYGKIFKYKGRMIDIGCAEGSLIRELKRMGWDVTGIEISKYFQPYECLRVFVGDYKDYKDHDPERKYDLVTLHHSLEHFAEPNDLIDFCKNLIHDQGYINVIIPITDNWNKNDNRWGHFNTTFWGEHVVLYSTDSFKHLCNKHDLEIDSEADMGADSKLFVVKKKLG